MSQLESSTWTQGKKDCFLNLTPLDLTSLNLHNNPPTLTTSRNWESLSPDPHPLQSNCLPAELAGPWLLAGPSFGTWSYASPSVPRGLQADMVMAK